MKKLYFALLTGIALQAQPTIGWERTFGGSDSDYIESVKPTGDGYVCMVRSSSSISGIKTEATRGNQDFWIIKTDLSGNIVWQKTLGGSDLDFSSDIAVAVDGSIYCGGYSLSGISGDKTEASRGEQDYWVIKLDAAGNSLWQRTFGGDHADLLFKLIVNSDGNVTLCGYSFSGISGDKTEASRGSYDLWLVNLDVTGTMVWQKTLGGSGDEGGLATCNTADGGFVVLCHSTSGISGDRTVAPASQDDTWAIRFDASGNQVWQKALSINWPESVTELPNGNLIVTGHNSPGLVIVQSRLMRLDEDGETLWQHTGPVALDQAYTDNVVATEDGGYWYTSDSTADGLKVIRRNASDAIVWERTLNIDFQNAQLNSLIKNASNELVLGVSTTSGITADKSEASYGSSDAWLVKFNGEQLAIGDTEKATVSVFPNPVTDKLNIANAGASQIELYNSLGQRLLSQAIDPVQAQIDFPYPSGTYFLKINGENSHTVKIIK